jgi:hypothetical protein
MLTETVDRFDPSFNVTAIRTADRRPADGPHRGLPQSARVHQTAMRLQPDASEGASAIIRGVTRAAGNEIDEFVTEALRNNLVACRSICPPSTWPRPRYWRATLNQARAEFYLMTGGDSQLKPYASWVDFASNLKHVESLVNFIAAYGTHESITAPPPLLPSAQAASDPRLRRRCGFG